MPDIMSIFQSDHDPSDKSAPPQVPQSGRTVISRKLRELYDTVQDEGIPANLLDLLEKLDDAENKSRVSEK
jgi:hypothetical protein